MNVKFIENLRDMLKLPDDKTIVQQEINRLTAPGENYGSLMLTIKIQIKNNKTNDIEEMNVVAKLPPPNEFIQKMFNTNVTFVCEIEFYKTIIPTLQTFQKDYRIQNVLNSYPKYYGSRLNLNQSDNVDNDAVLLLENLKLSDFVTVDRTVGFDLETAELILKNLAELHAIPIAMKQKNPELLNNKIVPLFKEFFLFQIDEHTIHQMNDQIMKALEGDEGIQRFCKNIIDVIDKNVKNFENCPRNSKSFIREPYTSIVHSDLWVNNIMIKFIDNKPIECKFVDFQIYEYGSIAKDVIFFLMTSVQLAVLNDNVDHLIKYYHDNLLDNLELYDCNIDGFTIENFENEIKNVLHDSELHHCLIMLNPIYAASNDVKEIEHLSEEDMKEERTIPIAQKQRSSFIVNYLHKKSWI